MNEWMNFNDNLIARWERESLRKASSKAEESSKLTGVTWRKSKSQRMRFSPTIAKNPPLPLQ